MNPYVYRRKAVSLSRVSGASVSDLPRLFKSVFTSQISSAIAFAVVAFAATSVGIISFAVHTEMVANIYEPAVKVVRANKIAAPAVLGIENQTLNVYQETMVTSKGNKVVAITARPIEYEAGVWRYELIWSRTKKASGSIYVNGSVLEATAPQQGAAKVELKPKTKTKVEFYSQPNKKGTLLVRKYFTTLPAPETEVVCTRDAKQCPDGNTYVGRSGPKCEFKTCPTQEAYIKVVNPILGLSWNIGTTYMIKWVAPTSVKTVDIYLQDWITCRESKPPCNLAERAPVVIATKVLNLVDSNGDGSAVFAWKAGSIQSGTATEGAYKIIVKSSGNSDVVGVSGGFKLSNEFIAICDYAAPPVGCNYIKGAGYNSQTQCGMVLKCESETATSVVSSLPSIRYLKVNTVISRSWVAWREIEVYGEDGNKIAPSDITAQYTWRNYPSDAKDHGPKLAIDGDINTVWNAGETAPNCNWFGVSYTDRMGCAIGNQSAWIQLDLGSAKKISKVKILTENTPNPASAVHQLLVSVDGKDYTKLHEFKGDIKSNTWLVYPEIK